MLLGACQTTPRPDRQASVAIEHVTVIDPETRRVIPDSNVYVDRGKIVAVVPARGRQPFASTRRLDGRGRFLIPGLIDMHVHLFLPEPAAPSLNLLLASGVTGIREMASDCWDIAGVKDGCVGGYQALQAGIASGATPGPELLALTSTMVMGPAQLKLPANLDPFIAPGTPDDARRLARYLGGRGVQILKTHDSIPQSAFFALLEEGRRQGLAVAGHVPFGAGSLAAAKAGYQTIEHARDLLYDCSAFGPEFRRRMSDWADRKPGSARVGNAERLRRTVAEHDASRCPSFLSALAATRIGYVPTHVTREMEARADEPGYRDDPARRYVMPKRDRDWQKDLDETAALPAEERAALDGFFRHGLEITRLAFQAGIPVMAGTDANDTMIVPGFSLHRELALLAEAGLPPMDVLRAATIVPAGFVRRAGDLGGVSAGKKADLVLLRRNPLADIRNTAAVEAVIANGRLFDRVALDGLLADVERQVAAAKATTVAK
jgi:hypothetical protein